MTRFSVRFCLVAGCILGSISVAAGAFGAHGLEPMLAASGQTENWDTAFRYSMLHALALVAAGLIAGLRQPPAGLAIAAGWCFLLGTLIFSGCLAALALTGITILGALVPIGGLLLIIGWLLLAAAAAVKPKKTSA